MYEEKDIYIKNNMKFTRTLKFKLTMWYSLILSIFCIAFLTTVNILITEYMNEWAPENNIPSFLVSQANRNKLGLFSDEQNTIIEESREEDLQNIRQLSIYSVIPLLILSFGGGYLLASIMLEPLDNLNKEIKKKEAENIDEEIIFEDHGDEISELIKSFNRMSNRLGKSFDSQKQFVENASHELKTPLALIQANIDMAMEDGEVSKEELNELLTNSKKHVKFMNSLVEDLLLMTIKDDIKKEKINVINFLEEIAKTATNKDFSVTFVNNIKQKDKIGVYIEGNEVLLQRAIMNIVENSEKYSEGNKLEIKLDKKEDKSDLIITLTDNGKGIPKEQADKIFERFYRIDKSRSREKGGTGLGLSITKKIIESHDGHIYLNTENKKGAEFVIQLNEHLGA